MPTGYVDPNGETQAEWWLGEGPSNWGAVADEYRQPDDPREWGGDIFPVAPELEDIYTMTTLVGATVVTEIKIWVFLTDYYGETPTIGIDIDFGGATVGQQTYVVSAMEEGWISKTFTGDWSQSDLDALKIHLEAISDVGPGSPNVHAVYGEITYSAGGNPPFSKGYIL